MGLRGMIAQGIAKIAKIANIANTANIENRESTNPRTANPRRAY
jgi:hypothetical protein